jgi:hypothetical protein
VPSPNDDLPSVSTRGTPFSAEVFAINHIQSHPTLALLRILPVSTLVLGATVYRLPGHFSVIDILDYLIERAPSGITLPAKMTFHVDTVRSAIVGEVFIYMGSRAAHHGSFG